MKRIMFFCLLSSACAPTLAGQLKGPDGALVASPDARVNISSLGSDNAEPTSLVIEVDSSGKFSTDAALTPGPYLVEALVPGYSPESKRVMLGETEGLEIQLKALPKKGKPTAVGARADADQARGAGGATLTPPSL